MTITRVPKTTRIVNTPEKLPVSVIVIVVVVAVVVLVLVSSQVVVLMVGVIFVDVLSLITNMYLRAGVE